MLPSLAVSGGIGLIGAVASAGGFVKATLFVLAFIAPLFHYIIYDLAHAKEYYFYYNFGLSRLRLWAGTAALSALSLIISACL